MTWPGLTRSPNTQHRLRPPNEAPRCCVLLLCDTMAQLSMGRSAAHLQGAVQQEPFAAMRSQSKCLGSRGIRCCRAIQDSA